VKTPSWSHTDDEGLYAIPVELEDEKHKASGSATLHVGNIAPYTTAWGYIWSHDIGVRPESSKLLCPDDPFKVGIIVKDPEGDEVHVKATIVETGQSVDLEREGDNITYTGILIAPGRPGKYTIRFDAVETKTKRKKRLPKTTSPLEVDPCAERNVTQVDVAGGTTPANRQALLIKVAGTPGTNCDEIRIKVPKKIAKEASAGLLPEGWVLRSEKDVLIISGSKVSVPCHLRVDTGMAKPPKKVDVEVMLEGEKLFHQKGTKVALHPPSRLSSNFDGILKFPPLICAGELIEFMPLDFEKTPLGGTWIVAGKPAVEVRGQDRYVVALPDNLSEGDSISLSYTDPYGIELYRTVALPEIQVAPCPKGVGPFITGVTRLVFPGDMICVCGFFPDLSSRYGLFLNGQSDHQVVSTSGGKDNKVEKMVKGIQRGDFNLTYKLVLDFCPCK